MGGKGKGEREGKGRGSGREVVDIAWRVL